jgi:hypothetical protein
MIAPVLAFLALVTLPLLSRPADETVPIEIPESPAAALSLEPGPQPQIPLFVPLPDGSPFAPLPAPGQRPAELVGALAFAAALTTAAVFRRRLTVEEAYGHVRDRLQDNIFSDVVRGDLLEISKTMAGLPPAEADVVVGRMSARELGVWLREMDGWNGSLAPSEEAATFLLLATRLSAANLVRLASAGKTSEVIEAVGSFAPESVQAEFVELALGSLDGHQSQLAEMASSWHPSTLERFVEAAPTPSLFAALVPPTTARTWFSDQSHTLYVYDPAPYIRLLQAAVEIQDPVPKAQLFAEAAAGLANVDAGAGLFHGSTLRGGEELLGAMATLVRSDPDGVIGVLNHRLDIHGNATSSWARGMIERGMFDELQSLLNGLRGPDPLARFTTSGDDPARPFPYASNLGYFAGVLHLAIDSMADDATDQIDLLGAIFGEAAGLVPAKGVDLPVGFALDQAGQALASDLASGAATLQQTVWRLAKPRTPGGDLWNGAGTTQFQDSWEEVVSVR